MNRFYLLFLLLGSLGMCSLKAQDHDHDHSHEHGHSHEHAHRHHELAIGSGPLWIPGENLWGIGTHVHGLLALSDWMGAGLGYEWIASEHRHHSLYALMHFHPIHPLDINIGPGFTFPDEENPDYRFKVHAEVAAVFPLGERFHLGPSLDLGWGMDDLHLSLGVHLGWIIPARQAASGE